MGCTQIASPQLELDKFIVRIREWVWRTCSSDPVGNCMNEFVKLQIALRIRLRYQGFHAHGSAHVASRMYCRKTTNGRQHLGSRKCACPIRGRRRLGAGRRKEGNSYGTGCWRSSVRCHIKQFWSLHYYPEATQVRCVADNLG